MLTEKIKSLINKLTEENRQRIFEVAEYIWKNPETGYREWKTSAFLFKHFEDLGYKVTGMENIPGFYADLDTGRPGPTLAVLGELDSIICKSHPEADSETGAVHACGHHSQCAYLTGVAAIMRNTEILSSLCGKVRFIAVPAEELLELEFRSSLKKEGIVKYFGGKVEFLHRGVFDGIAAAIMIHSGSNTEKPVSIYKGNNGCLTKNISYRGIASHAGGSPDKGINALYAAMLGLNAINAVRETFKEENVTRVHPIINEGGIAVNVIPDLVRLETFVRGSSPEAIVSENKKVNRALAGAALSIGANLRILDVPGYMPLHNAPSLNKAAKEAAELILGAELVEHNNNWHAGSTDMGDLSSVMPVVHASGGGGEGIAHGNDYRVANTEEAYIHSTRFIAALAYNLLSDNASGLIEIKNEYKAPFGSYKEYFDFIDKLFNDRELIIYGEDSAKAEW